MNAEQFETMLKSVKDMSEEQRDELVATLKHHGMIPNKLHAEKVDDVMDQMRAHHVVIHNYWTKTDIEKIAGRAIDDESFQEFRAEMNYGCYSSDLCDKVQEVERELNICINDFFELGHAEDDEWFNKVYERDELVETEETTCTTSSNYYYFKRALSFAPDYITLPEGVQWVEEVCDDIIMGICSKYLGAIELQELGRKLEEQIVK
jgi:hypothetical protein